MSELNRRQHEAQRYQRAIAAEREGTYVNPDKDWAERIAVEMLLVIQSMKFEYHPSGNVVVQYFCIQNGLDFEELENMAMVMASDDPMKPQP